MGFTKIIQSGNYLEIYEYEKQLRKFQTQPFRQKGCFNEKIREITRRRIDNVSRVRKSFIRLVRANLTGDAPPVLLTLTMREVVSIKCAYAEFRLFVMRLRYEFGRGFRYISVPEFQKRGAVHFHVLVWGLSEQVINDERETRFIAKLWGQGFIDILKTDGSSKLASYLGKYMSKAVYDKRLSLQKAYVASRNILRPLSFANSMAFEYRELIWGVDNLIPFEKIFDTLWLGRCIYKAYNLIPK